MVNINIYVQYFPSAGGNNTINCFVSEIIKPLVQENKHTALYEILYNHEYKKIVILSTIKSIHLRTSFIAINIEPKSFNLGCTQLLI